MRVQKLRCDEVELFSHDIWEAAQLTTRGKPNAKGTVEAFSTMHVPNGLMQKLLEPAETSHKKIFAWCVWDVIEKCPDSRLCSDCSLWSDCGGRAKSADGFVHIDDVIAMKSRVSTSTWSHEMLCHPPRFEDAVFPNFSRAIHLYTLEKSTTLSPGHSLEIHSRSFIIEKLIAGVDFGFAGAFVCLWLLTLREEHTGKRAIYVLDELVAKEQTLEKNGLAMKARHWNPSIVYGDVAGKHRNAQTGHGDETVLRNLGFTMKSSWMRIEKGLAVLRDLLEPADGRARFFIHPQCAGLIGAFEGYRRGKDGSPNKDGTHDHLIDALRYAVCGETSNHGKLEIRTY